MADYDPQRVKWRVDYEKSCLCDNFQKRGWIRTDGDDWNLFWSTTTTTQRIFNPKKGTRLLDNQLISHFPNSWELTQKNSMIRNIKRYTKDIKRQQLECSQAEIDSSSMGSSFKGDFIIPSSYLLPSDYAVFCYEYRKQPNALYIAKPAAGAQG